MTSVPHAPRWVLRYLSGGAVGAPLLWYAGILELRLRNDRTRASAATSERRVAQVVVTTVGTFEPRSRSKL
jgi:hypothetical protein